MIVENKQTNTNNNENQKSYKDKKESPFLRLKF